MASASEVLPVAAAAGELLLRCGADVARVEDTVAHIARAYGIPEVQTFATPTGLFISLGGESHVTMIKRVRNRTMALDRVSAINTLSRSLAVSPIPPAEALARIQQVAEQPGPVPSWSDFIFSGIAAAGCTMLVGGTPPDFFPALLANLLVQGVGRVTGRLSLPEVAGDFLSGIMAVASGLALNQLTGASVSAVVAGGIMVLLPGTAFTSSIRDALAGDLVSAGARMLEAALKAGVLAAGVASALYLTGGPPL